MTKPTQSLGGRLPLADPATLTSAQRDLFEALKATWVVYANELGVQATTEDGRLIGPFNAFLLHPEVTAKLSEFQAAEAAHTTLPPRVREVVIIAVGAVWGADYELYAQINVARKAGLSDHAITTLANSGIPEDLSDHEKIAARLARELSTRHRVDDELYREAEQAFGRTGLFDIAALMGLYHTVCTALALFEVPAPGAVADLGESSGVIKTAPMSNRQKQTSLAAPALFTPLGHDTHDRSVGELTVSGTLPGQLNGVLFRNGPGKFNRGRKTKRTVPTAMALSNAWNLPVESSTIPGASFGHQSSSKKKRPTSSFRRLGRQ